MHDDALVQLMQTETDSPPPTRIDLALVIRDGKRRRRRRAMIAPAVAGVAVVALAAGIGAVAYRHPTALPNPPAASPTSTPPPAAPARFDPLRLHVAAGWVPDGLSAEPTVSSPTAQRLRFSVGGELANPPLTVTIYTAGIVPFELRTARDRPRPTISVAPPVNGRPAQSWSWRTGSFEALAWQWAPDAWAVASYLQADATARRDQLRRFAENVRTNVDVPILVPFTATPTAPLRLAAVTAEEHAPTYEYTMDLSLADSPDLTSPIDVKGAHPEVSIIVSLDNEPRQPAPNRVIGGHAAYLRSDEFGLDVVLWGVSGYRVSVRINNAEGRASISQDQALAMALSVVPLGPPSDRSQWTNTPLR